MKKNLFILFLFVALSHVVKAQTVTDPWANIDRQPYYMVIDASNNIYVTSFPTSTISKITPNGTVTAAWATVGAGPAGIVIDATGNLYTVNRTAKTISKITPSTDGSYGTVTQFASLGGNEAYTISMDASGNLYAPFVSTNKIAKITSAGSANLSWVTFGDGSKPFSLIFDTSGNLYSANASNSTVHKINSSGTILTTWTLATGSNFQLMTFDPAGNLYIACEGNSTVSKITPSGTASAAWASLTGKPSGIVSDADGNIFTANHNTHTISKITSSGAVTQAFATLATGSNPFYLMKDANGNLYTTNQGNNSVSKISYLPSASITSSASGAVCAGTNVTFTAVASNISSPTYQWYKNSVAINGANSATYSTTTLTNGDQVYVNVKGGSSDGAIVTDGLRFNLDAGNSASYSGTGTTWTDLSGNGNHGTLVNGATYSSDNGGSILFNGTNSNINLNKNATGIGIYDKSYTADAWVYPTDLGGFRGMFGDEGAAFRQGLHLTFSNGNIYQGHYGYDANAGSVSTNNWYHIVFTYDKATGATKIYKNGVYQGASNNIDSYVGTTNIHLGQAFNNSGFFQGKGAVYKMYDRVLLSAEVTTNYNALKNRFSATGVNSTPISTTVNSVLATPAITIIGDGCMNKTTLSTTSGLTSYTWYKDNLAISGATSNTYIPTTAGDYKVEVSNGTCTNISSITSISICGLTSDGKMLPIENATTLISKDGATNSGKGIDERGSIITKPIYYGTVTTGTGRIWLDRNLGASRVATSSTDTQAFGDYYQWGRPTDGHQSQYITNNNSTGFTNTKSTTSVPPNGLWIQPNDGSEDWLITANNTLWVGANPSNNPCPPRFRIPTLSEWQAEQALFTSNNSNGAFNYSLKLTMPGWLENFDNNGASFIAKSSGGFYLTQTANSNGSVQYFGINSVNVWNDTNLSKRRGLSCRCIKN
jgi:streptogramin lyase